MLLLLRIRWICGSFGERHRSSRPSRRPKAYICRRASWIRSRVPPEVNPLFSSSSFLRVLCFIRTYRMKSNTFHPIWSVTSENNTGIRHFRWAGCWSLCSEEKSWNDVTNRTRPRPNLIVFSLRNVSNGGVFCLLWKFTRIRGFS